MSARDVRYGRRGGRWLPDKPADVASIEEWRRRREALRAAAEAAGEQLTFDALLEHE